MQMKLLKSLAPIAIGMGAGYFLGGGTVGGAASSAVVKELASSFLTTTGFKRKDGTTQLPFKMAVAPSPRSVKELTRGNPSQVPPQLQPIQKMISANPQLATAMSNLYQNAQNQQVRDMFASFQTADVQPTIRQGRRTIVTEQPKNIQVTV